MSPKSANAGPTAKPRLNIYTMMLILSFAFLVAGSIMLYLELGTYGAYPWWNTAGAR